MTPPPACAAIVNVEGPHPADVRGQSGARRGVDQAAARGVEAPLRLPGGDAVFDKGRQAVLRRHREAIRLPECVRHPM